MPVDIVCCVPGCYTLLQMAARLRCPLCCEHTAVRCVLLLGGQDGIEAPCDDACRALFLDAWNLEDLHLPLSEADLVTHRGSYADVWKVAPLAQFLNDAASGLCYACSAVYWHHHHHRHRGGGGAPGYSAPQCASSALGRLEVQALVREPPREVSSSSASSL